MQREREENEEHRQFVLMQIPQGTASSVHEEYSRHFDPPYESSDDESDDGRKYGNGSKYRCLYNDQLLRFSNKENRYVPCYAQTLKGEELREDPYDKKDGNTWVYSICSKHCSTCLGCSPGCGKDTRVDWTLIFESTSNMDFELKEAEVFC